MLTLRQIEVVRAVMVTGTIAGAARLLNVSAPGISRLMKYTEDTLGFRLFIRRHGRYDPTPEARDVFDLIDTVYKKVEDLQTAIDRMKRGETKELSLGSVPSIANVMVPRAVERLRGRYPQLRIDINILKVEDAVDYLLLGKGEVVAMSYRFDHPIVTFAPLARGRLLCIVPQGHPLAGRRSVSPDEIVRYPLIGIDPSDPFGSIMAEIFARRRLPYDTTIRARFGSTVCSLVASGLGIAVVDQFTVAHGRVPGVVCLEIDEDTGFETYAAHRNDGPLSTYAEDFVAMLRDEMRAVTASEAPTRE
ncbi:LysR family transcriptional regulator [Thalassobaculum fulvum]|uniref:LysR family transcriptional regulator n=1 Tax=Thalassobaculum fulvum TaxID=1633335 RepID=A0A919CSE4_9PROT|nr:LysR family transcriptional regulator [Thalassobaculum fulvum]GHD62043.1 LysR family transcriptional regulator [Thalassobaculum fulvum]